MVSGKGACGGSRVVMTVVLVAMALGGCMRESAAPTAPVMDQPARRPPPPEETIVDRLEWPQVVGQVFMVGVPGGWSAQAPAQLGTLPAGWAILYARNISSRAQLEGLVADLADVTERVAGCPALIAIDHEGGRVDRLPKSSFTHFPAASQMTARPLEEVREEGRVMAAELREVGIHMNLAPVADVLTNPRNADISNRSFGGDTAHVAERVVAFIEGAHEADGLVCAKHFPGYGPIAENPHASLPTVDLAVAQWQQVHAPPFRAAIDAGVDAVMTGHVVWSALDPQAPASLSRPIVTDVLRKQWSYDGLILTDDLEMGAVGEAMPVGQAAERAIRAGADVALICHTAAAQRAAYHRLLALSERDPELAARIREAAVRVLRTKLRMGLIEPPTAAASEAGPESATGATTQPDT